MKLAFKRLCLGIIPSLLLSLTLRADVPGTWDDRFGLPLNNGEVFVLASSSNRVVAGGAFTLIGGATITNLAVFDGRNWAPFGQPDGPVYAIKAAGNHIYVGGEFNSIGGIAASKVALWDGQSWRALGAGIRGSGSCVNAIELFAKEVIVAGRFQAAGELQTFNIARWNGARWDRLWLGLGDASDDVQVNALAVIGSDLYAAGRFFQSGTLRVNHIARWNGVFWQPLQNGVQGPESILPDRPSTQVFSLLPQGRDLIVGGSFCSAGAMTATNIARWNGANWSGLGNGLEITVLALSGDEQCIFAGGTAGPYQRCHLFEPASFGGSARVHRFESNRWDKIADFAGLDRYNLLRVKALLSREGLVFASGTFVHIDGFIAQGLTVWDGRSWNGVGNQNLHGLSDFPYKVVAIGTNVFAAGYFIRAGSTNVSGLGRWDGGRWCPIGTLRDGAVFDMTRQGDSLIIVGNFSHIDGVAAKRVARWDGSHWRPLSDGLDGELSTVTATDQAIYAAGFLNVPGLGRKLGVARWDGTSWQLLSDAFSPWGHIQALAARGNELYVAGQFEEVGAVHAKNIAFWNGSTWNAVGQGLTGEAPAHFICRGMTNVAALVFFKGDLIAAGSFTRSADLPLNNIARWDGYKWSPLALGIPGTAYNCFYQGQYIPVTALTASEDAVYVGGMFPSVGTVPASLVAKWDGQQWSNLRSGLSGSIPAFEAILCDYHGAAHPSFTMPAWGQVTSQTKSLAWNGTNLYVGGNFSLADGKPSVGFAIWHEIRQPRIWAERVDGQLKLSWSDWATNFVLESTSDLHGISWQRVLDEPNHGSETFTVRLPINSSLIFFRLRQR
jgi:trimeric autotransporter adhesin